MLKMLCFDCETGGINPYDDALLTLSGCLLTLRVEPNGKMVVIGESNFFDIKMQPIEGKLISDEALEVNGITREELNGFRTAKEGFEEFQKVLDKMCFKWDKKDKMYMMGYNVQFDVNFLASWFSHFSPYLGSYVNWKTYDLYRKMQELEIRFNILEGLSLENLKLKTVCNHFGIEFKAHNSLFDIVATKELFKKLEEYIYVK